MENLAEVDQVREYLTLSIIVRPVESSFMQVRDCLPVYWRQDIKLLVPEPIIEVDFDMSSLLGMKQRFNHVLHRYGLHLTKDIKKNVSSIDNFEVDLKNLKQVNKKSLYKVLARI